MKIPTKFLLNINDYKVFFDNDKKTYVCEDLQSGEKTNIGVLGTFMQMGIIKPVEESLEKPDERLSYLMDKVASLEERLIKMQLITSEKKSDIEKSYKNELTDLKTKAKRDPVLKKHPETEEEPNINHRIMEKLLEKTIEEENEPKIPKDVKVESDEEIENWSEI